VAEHVLAAQGLPTHSGDEDEQRDAGGESDGEEGEEGGCMSWIQCDEC